MKKIFLIMMTVLVGVLLVGCAGASSGSSSANNSEAYHKITPEQAKRMMVENPKAIILDVRTASEYTEKHIPKAKLVPNEDIKDQPIAGVNKEDVVLVYCRTGHRSKQASDKLVKMGYQHIYDFGGITTWPYETEAGAYQGN